MKGVNTGLKPDCEVLKLKDFTQESIREWLKLAFNLSSVSQGRQLQPLWSGYGDLVQFDLLVNINECDSLLSIVAKWVKPPLEVNHPRGWQSNLAHQRKITSYQVEKNAYALFNQTQVLENWPTGLRMPYCYHASIDNGSQQQLLVLEDLNQSGFSQRFDRLSVSMTYGCIQWLADLHGYFLIDREKGKNTPFHLDNFLTLDKSLTFAQGLYEPYGTWPVGSYWHLATRPDEWQAMPNSKLKEQAGLLDKTLNELRFQTLIHGDAKVANFCFSNPQQGEAYEVAALDFQYLGMGCGMKDVIYFLGSCLTETECEQNWQTLLDLYFFRLKETLASLNSSIPVDELETEWRFAFELAWADFQRFLEGWSPTHKKNTDFSRALTASALSKL